MAAGGRLLIIETSSRPLFDHLHRFYSQLSYTRCSQVPDFYGEGDDKVIFSKQWMTVSQ